MNKQAGKLFLQGSQRQTTLFKFWTLDYWNDIAVEKVQQRWIKTGTFNSEDMVDFFVIGKLDVRFK